jgi:hypothetical protein
MPFFSLEELRCRPRTDADGQRADCRRPRVAAAYVLTRMVLFNARRGGWPWHASRGRWLRSPGNTMPHATAWAVNQLRTPSSERRHSRLSFTSSYPIVAGMFTMSS